MDLDDGLRIAMRRPRGKGSSVSAVSSATDKSAPASDIQRRLSSSTSLPSAEAEAVLTGFRAHSGGVVLFVGDSIAEELAQYLQGQLGMKEVIGGLMTL